MRPFFIFFFLCISLFSVTGQEITDSVETKIWRRNTNRDIVFSDWIKMPVRKISKLPNFKTDPLFSTNKYGGKQGKTYEIKGFFYTHKTEDRWKLIDPLGNEYYEIGVTSLRPGKSPSNKLALQSKFKDDLGWFSSTAILLFNHGFKSIGSWSEISTAREFNKTAEIPVVYSTQLNVLNAFNAYIRKEFPNRKISNIISLILDPSFPDFCRKHLSEQIKFKDDPNLFGHFSDNELPFLISTWEAIVTADSTDYAFISAKKYLDSLKTNRNEVSKEQKEVFIASIAELYFKVVSTELKKIDPNHLYLGSRIHSTAKENAALLKVASNYVDAMSINYYGYWDLTEKLASIWAKNLEIPFFITEFYTKGNDVGMKNISGAGWIVKNQNDRAAHYENFTLKLLENKQCVGWHWFRYQDNDPTDLSADPSNQDSNKGIVNIIYEPYIDLLLKMKEIHYLRFHLLDYFDAKN